MFRARLRSLRAWRARASDEDGVVVGGARWVGGMGAGIDRGFIEGGVEAGGVGGWEIDTTRSIGARWWGIR